ncbi:MAG: AAA family ATPase, partial [Chthoniobacteraceae bacterium]
AKGWEISGVPRSVVERFSRRTAEIEKLAAEKGITDAKKKDALGASSREGKRKGVAMKDLRKEWESRVSEVEFAAILGVKTSAQKAVERITPAAAVDYAEEKLFAKNSVIEMKRLVAEAMRYGVGHLAPARVWEEVGKRDMIVRKLGGEFWGTSAAVLAEEVALINFVRGGRNMAVPFEAGSWKGGEQLSAEQRAAVRHLLSNRDQVMAIRGGAGVGKTTLMKEAVAAIETNGLKVFAFAPSAAASRETLREAGFENAETVAHLLQNQKLQLETRGQVIWIDEAGLLGVRDMWRIMQIAGQGTRVILTGDTAQHAPVARGDAFRLLQKYAGLTVAEVTQIRRQEREVYREAVFALSQGDLKTAFRRLDDLGAIVEVPNDEERYRMLAHDFVNLSRGKSVPLVVSPTHAEAAKVTDAIRAARFEVGQLKGERSFLRWHNLQWEEGDRKRAENYREGHVVQFHQNAPGAKRGEMFHIKGFPEDGRVRAVSSSGREVLLPLQHASRFLVYEAREIQIARGERIRITRNGETADGRRISNGNVFTVKGFAKDGSIVLTTGAVLDAKHGHFTHGYCQTSHSSQSKSVRDVLIAQSADSFLAASREQFYVSVSRAKESIRIYTDDRRGLQQAVGNSSLRRSGIELAGIPSRDIHGAMSDIPDATKWRDFVRKHGNHVEGKSFGEKLQSQRKGQEVKVGGETNWKAYVAMRRAIAGPDGKSRSKGSPSVSKTGGSKAERGRSFIRPTQPHISPEDRQKAKEQPKPKKPSIAKDRMERATKAVKGAGQNLRKLANRLNGRIKEAVNKWPKSNTKQAAKHGLKQRNAESATKTQTKAKAQTKAKVQVPPPTPKKGR